MAKFKKRDVERYAPVGSIWVCSACGKTSRADRYGDAHSTPGWDCSCAINAVLVKVDDILERHKDGRVKRGEMMISITVEIVPHGKLLDRKIIGTMDIINDGTGSAKAGNYYVRAKDEMYEYRGKVGVHKRDMGFWKLLTRAITNMEIEEE